MAKYTYQHEVTKELYRNEVGGDVVTVIERTEQDDPSGKWVIMVNGIARMWYAIEASAVRVAKRHRIGAYGGTFGFPVNPTGRM